MDKLLFKFYSLLFSFLLLVSCSDKNKPEINKPQYGGKLKILINDPVTTLDPINILYDSDLKVASIIYEGLVGFDSTGSVKPLLAESWKKLDDGKRWIFNLRKDVYFQNDPCFKNGKGKKFSAEDVYYTFHRMAEPNSPMVNLELFESKIEGFKQFHSGLSKSISGIKVIDSTKIEFRLTKPYVTFLKLLATACSFIVPREANEFYGKDFGKHPVGTGPFRLSQWQKWKQILLVKNRMYWGKSNAGNSLPYLDQIEINVADKSRLIIPQFLKNETNILMLNKTLFNNFSGTTGFNDKFNFFLSNSGVGLRFFGFSMNNRSATSKSKEIRKAIAYAFDKEKLFDPAKFSGYVANTLAPQYFLNGNIKNKYRFNFSKAKHIIKDLINLLGKDTIEIFSSIKSPAVEALNKNIGKLGLKSKVTVKKLRYYENIILNQPDIFRVSMFPSIPDPEEYYALFYSESGKNINLGNYKNTKYDELFRRSMLEQDPVKRNKLFLELEKILSDDLPAIYLMHEGVKYYVYPKYIHGISMKFNIPSYKSVWLDLPDAKKS